MKKFSFKGLSPVIFLFSANAFAQADIHFTEFRVLLTDKKTKVDYQVFNQGNTDAVCTTSLVDYDVADNGKLTFIKDKNATGPETSAKAANLIRVSPKRFTVKANNNQKLKVIARQLRRQQDGEWVSYLGITCREASPKLQSGVNILPNFNYHIPVVVRKGNLQANIEVTDLALTSSGSQSQLSAKLKRAGDRSVYGDFVIKEVASGKVLARQNGISHYLQSTAVPFTFNLQGSPTGPIEVSFIENKSYGGELTTSTTLNN